MGKIEKFVEKLEKFNSDTKTENWSELFRDVAEDLIRNFQIKFGESIFDILEVEVYFYNQYHRDGCVHKHNLNAGSWRGHLSGLDITFGSNIKSDCVKKECKECHESCHYGGILIRSIKNTITNEIINGPLSTVLNGLLQGFLITSSPVFSLRNKERDEKSTIESTLRCGIGGNGKEFADNEYCFFVKDNIMTWKSSYRSQNKKRLKLQ